MLRNNADARDAHISSLDYLWTDTLDTQKFIGRFLFRKM